MIDPVADPQTRTFTLTLLMLNEKLSSKMRQEAGEGVATTDQTWRLDFKFLPGAKAGEKYVSKKAICQDDEGYYVWRVENASINQPFPEDRRLKVRKMRIRLGEKELPFLGNWLFQEIELLDDTFDPSTNLIAGKLTLPDARDPNTWDGDTVLLERGSQWMVRPGDLVVVDIGDTKAKPGIYVPMDAIAHLVGKTYLFLIEEEEGQKIVRRVEVNVLDDSNGGGFTSNRLVEPTDSSVKLAGRQCVVSGSHYLRDGEPVLVAPAEGGAQ